MLQYVRKSFIELTLWMLISTTVTQGFDIPNRREIELTAQTLKAQAPDNLAIRYYDDNNQVVEVFLKKVLNTIPSSLLPIFHIKEVNDESIDPRLNNFLAICYHGINTRSAITYFPHTDTLHGVIDYRFYIRDLPRTQSAEPDVVESFMHPMTGNEFPREPIHAQNRGRRTVGGSTFDARLNCSLHKKYTKTFYAEVLLIIDTAARADHYNDEAPHEKTVMYALAYWNAVDMLFSHLKRTRIKINIAGIAVGWTRDVAQNIIPNAWHSEDNSRFYYMDNVALHNVGRYVQHYRLEVSRSSYDFLIWMTEASILYPRGQGPERASLGISAPPADCGGLQEVEEETELIANRAVVLHDAKYSNYHTAARVLASMMFVSIDDINRPDSLSEGPSRGIMDPLDLRVEGCLRWSYQSELDFFRYVGSRSSCCLLNFPHRTMEKPSTPISDLTVDEQCQCYRLQADEYTDYSEDICGRELQCVDQDHTVHELAWVLDGTPCQAADGRGICRWTDCVSP